MKRSQFSKSEISWKQLLLDKKVLTCLSHLTNSSRKIVERKAFRLYLKLRKQIRCEGIVNVCKRLKDSHKSYLRNQVTSWFSLDHFRHPKISDLTSRILMGIHRNMKTKKVNYGIDTICSPKVNLKTFFSKYSSELEIISKSSLLKFPYRLMGDYSVKHKDGVHEGFPRLGNLSNDITVDSNDRTGGLEYPLRVTLASSVNGPTICSQPEDAYLLLRPENTRLYRDIRTLWWMYGYKLNLDYYKEKLENDTLSKELNRPVEQLSLGRLYALRDKSCKTRIIAIIDTFSQIALRPIHNLLDEVMKRVLNDFFDNHQKGVEYLMKLDEDMWSFDITSATDTIPVELGLWVLRDVLGKWKSSTFRRWHSSRTVKAVERLLTWRQFRIGDTNEYIKYSKGQPMGAYSSFPLLGLTQHLLVHLAGVLTYGKVKKLKYAVVGDDIVIANEKVAMKYLDLCREVEIPIKHKVT